MSKIEHRHWWTREQFGRTVRLGGGQTTADLLFVLLAAAVLVVSALSWGCAASSGFPLPAPTAEAGDTPAEFADDATEYASDEVRRFCDYCTGQPDGAPCACCQGTRCWPSVCQAEFCQ